jgi:hypothetical protein
MPDQRLNTPRLLVMTCAAVLLAACGSSAMRPTPALPPAGALPRSASSHVVVIVMENEEAGGVLGSPAAPYLNALARRYASRPTATPSAIRRCRTTWR